MNAAADEEENTTRDVEMEMLDIMELDKTLDSMEERRGRGSGSGSGSGTKRVLFDT